MQTAPCPQCQTPVPATHHFCTQCGAPLEAAHGTPGTATPPEQATSRRTGRGCLIASTVAVLACCIGIVIVLIVAAAGIVPLIPYEKKSAPDATAVALAAESRRAEVGTRIASAAFKTWTRPTDGAEMVYVPAGEFLMGSAEADPDARSSEQPQHAVYVDAFWIDRTEVTEGQWRDCVEAGACPAQRGCGDARFSSPDLPAMCVSWHDAQAYAKWVGGRLPTEAEWEKAARGTDGRLYPWGNSPPDRYRASHGTGLLNTMVPAGTYPAWYSPYGALDMAGSVQEWVADWYDEEYYERSGSHNPQGPETGEYRVLRGGGWSSSQKQLRSASRQLTRPDTRSIHKGFRVVVAPGPPAP